MTRHDLEILGEYGWREQIRWVSLADTAEYSADTCAMSRLPRRSARSQ